MPYVTGNNAKETSQNQRLLNYQRGEQLNDINQRAADYAGANVEGYQGYLDPKLRDWAEGLGGYSPEEAAAIQDQAGLDQISAELPGNYLTGEERAAMMGDTGSYTDYFDPNAMHDSLAASQGVQDTAMWSLKGGLKDSIDPGALRQSQDYANAAHDQINANQNNVRGALVGEQEAVRGAIDPGVLRQSGEAADRMTMTPEEEDRIVKAAGISSGIASQAEDSELERRARAAGMSPLGVAAAQGRNEQERAINAANAMTQARVGARAEAAREAAAAEQQRLGAEQYLSGEQVGAELKMGQQGLESEAALGQQALNQANTQEANRQAAQQYLTGAQLQAATIGGEAELQNAQAKTQQGQQQNQYVATTGANIRQAQDTANANRAAGVAQNRQQVGIGNQNTQMNVSNARSGRAQTVGNTRLNQQNTGMGMLQGQEQMYNQNQNNAYGRQQQGYSTASGAGNAATGNVLGAYAQPTAFDKVTGAVLGAAGAAAKFIADGDVATEPELAIVGEDGPEMIVPVPYRSRPAAQTVQQPKKARTFYGEAA